MYNQLRLERLKREADLPAPFRKYILQTTLYTLKQMPADPVEQRRIMLEQQDATETHYENGREIVHRTAKFRDAFHPNLVGLPQTIICSAETTHDIRENAEDYITNARSSIMMGVDLDKQFLGGHDTEDKDMFMLALRLEKFWRSVAATAELTEKEHNLVPVGQFGVYGYGHGTGEYRGLQFNYADYPKIVTALQKMLVNVNAEINAVASDSILERVNTGNTIRER